MTDTVHDGGYVMGTDPVTGMVRAYHGIVEQSYRTPLTVLCQ